MSRKKQPKRKSRRSYDDDFKAEAVQMLLDGHSAQSVVDRLGISGTNLLYRWKRIASGRCWPSWRKAGFSCAGTRSGTETCRARTRCPKKSFGHFRPARVTEIYPVAQGIIEDKIASEREVCQFLDFARSPFQRWSQFDLSPLEGRRQATFAFGR